MAKDRNQVRSNGSMLALRGILALAIIWGHLAWGTSLELFGKNIFYLISFPGRIIVWLFFIISGFTICYGYQQEKYGFGTREILRFYFNRAIRILPLFYLTSVIGWLSLLMIAPQDLPLWQTTLRTILIPVLNVNFNLGVFSFTPTWFIGILIQLYLVTPILAKTWILIRKKVNLPLMFALLLIFSVVCHYVGYFLANSWDIRNIIGCLPLFLFGFFGCDVIQEIQSLKNIRQIEHTFFRFRWTIYLLLFIVIEAIFLLYQEQLFFNWPFESVVGVFGCALIVIMYLPRTNSFNETDRNSVFSRLLEILGKQSYGLYLWHPIMMTILLQTSIPALHPPPYQSITNLIPYFIIIAMASFLIAWIFNNILEKPYQALYMHERKEAKLV